jgi:predicted nucleic-acid-binding Zn-ribbon protein
LTAQPAPKSCPKCQGENRYWHRAGVFLVTEPHDRSSNGGFAPSAVVVCPECGFIEFYATSAALLKDLPEAEVPTHEEMQQAKNTVPD